MNKKAVQYFYITALTVLILLPVAFFTFFGKYFDTTNYENRELAPKPTLSLATIESYPADFESYFNDVLPFRNQLVFLNGLIDYKIFQTSSSDSVIVGKDGWLFYKGAQVNDEDPIADYRGTNLFSGEELETIKNNMVAARDELAARGIDFVVMIAPNKERVYSAYMPDAYGEPVQYGRMLQVVDYLRRHTDLTVVCPYEQLLAYEAAHPEQRIYYKYDTHWNNLGAYIGARELDAALGFAMPEAEDCTVTAGRTGGFDLSRLLHLDRYLFDDQVCTVSNYSPHTLESENNEDGTEFRFRNPAGDGAQEKLFIIGDSFSTMMAPFVACNYNETYLNFYYNYSGALLEREQPDVVVYETVERYMNNMLHFSIADGVTAE